MIKMQKIALTQEQIDGICIRLPVNRSLPEYVAKSIIYRIRLRLQTQLAGVMLYPPVIPRFCEEVVRSYWKTLCDSGTAVGIQASTSLGERQTQTTLNTFHAAGLSVKTVVVGVPRFSELLNATKSPKMVNCLIFLNEEFPNITNLRERVGSLFTDINMRRIVSGYRVMKNEMFEPWHYLFAELFDIDLEQIHPDRWRVRFYMNTDVMYEYKISMKMIRASLQASYADCFVMTTPESEGIVDVWMERFVFSEVDQHKGETVQVEPADLPENAENMESIESIENASDSEEEELAELVEEEDLTDEMDSKEEPPTLVEEVVESPPPQITFDFQEEIPHDIHRVIHMEDKVIPHLMGVHISGIEKIKDVFFEKRDHEWIIATEGSNLYGLFALPLVNKTRTICNNMWEIYNVLGIEAARQFLIEEYRDVVSSDGSYVNLSHIELLVDVMVYTGTIIAISRYGLKKVNCGPLAKASFEESVDNFLKAGLNSEKESTNSVSASIMLGKPPKTGTGVFDLMLNVDMLTKSFNSYTSSVSSSSSAQSHSLDDPPPASTWKSNSVVERKIAERVEPVAPSPRPSSPTKMSVFAKSRNAKPSRSSKPSKPSHGSVSTEFSKKNTYFDDD